MSHSTSLEEEVQRLSAELLRVSLEVDDLRAASQGLQERLSALEGRMQEAVFEVIPASSSGPSSTTAGYRVGSHREAAARDIGKWIRRCLNGQPRGLSGRERVAERSRLYLVVRNFHHQVFDPPQVFDTWSRAAEEVTQRGQPGDSIFVGLPSKEECRIVVEEAGLQLPASWLLGHDFGHP